MNKPVSKPAAMLKAMRPHQWLKNLLIFLPLVASHNISLDSLALGGIAFLAFSLLASSVYVTNDLMDLEADRRHPRKRLRPFASGTLGVATGRDMAIALAIAGAPLALFVGPAFAVVWITYLFTTLAYSVLLKRIAILDILTLSILYSTRIVAGGVAIGVQLSYWLLSFSIFIFFFLATVKRFGEIKDHAARDELEIAGRGYRIDDLPAVSMIAVSSGFVSVVVLALYVSSPDVVVYYSSPEFLWGACVTLIFWVSHIVLVTHRGEMHDDPIVFALRDRTSLISLAVVLGFATAAVGGLG